MTIHLLPSLPQYYLLSLTTMAFPNALLFLLQNYTSRNPILVLSLHITLQ